MSEQKASDAVTQACAAWVCLDFQPMGIQMGIIDISREEEVCERLTILKESAIQKPTKFQGPHLRRSGSTVCKFSNMLMVVSWYQ